jgi:opacity protein-like surface antigen
VVYIQGTRHSHAVATGNVTWDLVAGTLRAPRRITPFLAAGGGVFSTRTVFPAETFTSWEGAFTAGGGVRLAVTDRITLGLDARVGWEPHLRVGGVLGIRTGR